MRKLFAFIIAIVLISSCDKNDDPVIIIKNQNQNQKDSVQVTTPVTVFKSDTLWPLNKKGFVPYDSLITYNNGKLFNYAPTYYNDNYRWMSSSPGYYFGGTFDGKTAKVTTIDVFYQGKYRFFGSVNINGNYITFSVHNVVTKDSSTVVYQCDSLTYFNPKTAHSTFCFHMKKLSESRPVDKFFFLDYLILASGSNPYR